MRSHWLPTVLAVVGLALAGSGPIAPAATPAAPAAWPASAAVATAPVLPDGHPSVGSAAATAAEPAPAQAQDSFPHLAHEGLFPFCTGCHTGVPDGEMGEIYPEAEFCTGCHNGVDVVEIDWSPPTPDVLPDNLQFTHPGHMDVVASRGDDALDCQACHAGPDASRMTVEPLQAERCLSCHGHPAEAHVVDADCSTCHVPLARTELPPERIAGMSQPPSHQQPGFVLELHGQEALDGTARCATCHTRDLCSSCHVGGAADVIDRLEPAPGTMTLPAFTAAYPAPASHADPDFESEHRVEVEETADNCITCHTQEDCTSCHLPPLPTGTADLPARGSVEAPGVGLMYEAPATHADPFFLGDHGALAAADEDACASCHTEPFCASCHEAPARPEYHPANYVARHSADAWSSTSECSNCHQAQASCRACHVEAGLTQTGRLGSGYHDAEPVWLLRHPQAARQSLESCASCHTQKECLQCHSETGSFQVSPHGPDFDPVRAQERNPLICRACHIGDPLGGGGLP